MPDRVAPKSAEGDERRLTAPPLLLHGISRGPACARDAGHAKLILAVRRTAAPGAPMLRIPNRPLPLQFPKNFLRTLPGSIRDCEARFSA